MKFAILVAGLAAALCGPAFAETASVVLTDVPYNEAVAVDFGRELGDISRVEITMTSQLGPVSVCWEEWDGSFQSYPCGNLTVLYLGEAAMEIDGLGEIDHQSWDAWYSTAAAPGTVPVTDWSFLAPGTVQFRYRCWTDGCYADWESGQGYCGPDLHQVDEIVITVTTGIVPAEPSSWGGLKSIYR